MLRAEDAPQIVQAGIGDGGQLLAIDVDGGPLHGLQHFVGNGGRAGKGQKIAAAAYGHCAPRGARRPDGPPGLALPLPHRFGKPVVQGLGGVEQRRIGDSCLRAPSGRVPPG